MSVNEKMTAIADTIRNHTSETDKLTLDDMPREINRACSINFLNGNTEGYNYGYGIGYDEGIEKGYNSATEETNTELLDIIKLQESYIYPTILFYFGGTEYHIRESEAYWTNKLSFQGDWMTEPSSIWNDNGYAKWEYYTITDSQNNLIKYNSAIKNLETYWTSGLMEFFIQCDDNNTYTVKLEDWGSGISLADIINDNRFAPIRNDNYEYLGCYFIPEENGKKYLIPAEYSYVNIGDTVNATLVEGGNE